MRSGHGRAAGKSIGIIAGIAGRACACPRSCDVRLGAAAAVPGDGTPAAKASNRVRAGTQCASRVRRRIKGRRIRRGGTTWP